MGAQGHTAAAAGRLTMVVGPLLAPGAICRTEGTWHVVSTMPAAVREGQSAADSEERIP